MPLTPLTKPVPGCISGMGSDPAHVGEGGEGGEEREQAVQLCSWVSTNACPGGHLTAPIRYPSGRGLTQVQTEPTSLFQTPCPTQKERGEEGSRGRRGAKLLEVRGRAAGSRVPLLAA